MIEKRDVEKRARLKQLLIEIYDMRPSMADRCMLMLDYVNLAYRTEECNKDVSDSKKKHGL